jgi:two-component system chemotaxis response regulator CheB
VLRYRCHVGHGISADAWALSQVQGIERTLWSAVRALEEHAHLRRRMSLRARKGRMDDLAAAWDVEASEAEERAGDLRGLLGEQLAPGVPARHRRG